MGDDHGQESFPGLPAGNAGAQGGAAGGSATVAAVINDTNTSEDVGGRLLEAGCCTEVCSANVIWHLKGCFGTPSWVRMGLHAA
jgi:hypothetical protein